MPKDDVLTLKLPGANLVFTRYLYIKDEVKTALLLSILNKSDDAIFWAYELYYSGFQNELYAFIWQIYYDFFATLNPSFAVYLSKKLDPKEDLIEDRLISSIIQNLLIRSFNTDIFILRIITECFELDISATESEESEDGIEYLLDKKDYRGLALYILNKKDLDLEDTYQRVINYFKLTKQQRLFTKANTVKKEIILVANIFALINKSSNQIKRQNFYVRVDPEEVVQYETIEAVDNLKPYRILAQACVCKIGSQPFLNLFQGFRNQAVDTSIKEKDRGWSCRAVTEKYNSLDKWLYHAAFSPVWFSRIKSCKGYIDYVNQEVKFVDDDWEEAFYNKYGYEPDEQSLQTKENALNLTKDENTNCWQDFFAKYKKDGLIDALDEEQDALNEEPMKYA